ncbi:hypothetical protein GOODEAATRI_033538, partial [Goodea atripinnis]
EKTSFLWKVRIFLFNISCCAAAAYFFRRHNKYCETGGDGGHAAGGQKILILDQLEGQQGRGQRLILSEAEEMSFILSCRSFWFCSQNNQLLHSLNGPF